MVRTDDRVVDRRDGDRCQTAAVLQRLEPLDDVEVDRRHRPIGVDEPVGDSEPVIAAMGRLRELAAPSSARMCSSAAVKPTSSSRRHRLALVQSRRLNESSGVDQHVERMDVAVADDGWRRAPADDRRATPAARRTLRTDLARQRGSPRDARRAECVDVDPGALECIDDRMRVERRASCSEAARQLVGDATKGRREAAAIARPRPRPASSGTPSDALHHHERATEALVEAVEHDAGRGIALLGDRPLHDRLRRPRRSGSA